MHKSELVIGSASSGKTTYLINKAHKIIESDPQAKVALVSPSRGAANKIKELCQVEGIHALTPSDIVMQARHFLTGSVWGHEYESSWVSIYKIIETIREPLKDKGYTHIDGKSAVWFMVAAERNQWDEAEWKQHLFLWHGGQDSLISEIIHFIYDFLRNNNITFYALVFNQIAQALEGNESMLGYTHILIDDAQNLPLSEYNFLSNLAVEHSNITIAVDEEKQVHAWNEGSNADIKALFTGKYTWAAITEFEGTVGMSWQIKSVCENLLRKDGAPIKDDQDRIKLYQSAHEEEEAENIMRQVVKVAAKYPDKSILVTFRQAWFGRCIIKAAIAQGIYADIRTKDNKGFTSTADLIGDYLSLAVNPMNGAAFMNAMNQPARRLGKAAWVDMMNLRIDRSVTDWVALSDMLHEIKGIRKGQVNALNDFRNHIHNLPYLSGSEISDYILDDIGVREWVTEKYGNESVMPILHLEKAARDSTSLEDCLRLFEVYRGGATDSQAHIVIAPASQVINERFDYVWVAGVESGVFPLADDKTSYWSKSLLERDYRALYSIVSRANLGIAFWTAQARNINGRWRRTAIDPMVLSIVDMENKSPQGNLYRKPSIKSLKSLVAQGA